MSGLRYVGSSYKELTDEKTLPGWMTNDRSAKKIHSGKYCAEWNSFRISMNSAHGCDETMAGANDKDYRGCQTATKSGKTC
jgi:hypothetical protein